MILLAWIALALAALPAILVPANLPFYRRPHRRDENTPISVLIPARDEEAQIAGAVGSVLDGTRAAFEVIVLDDHSEDRTAAIVREIAAHDARVRLEHAPPLPAGWSGKQHACAVLAGLARHELLLFMDADVRLAPDALARLGGVMADARFGLASGFPRQVTGTLAEKLVVPVVHFLLLGYLPMIGLQLTRRVAFGAGCGQLMLVRRADYERAGGHAAIRSSMHDGLKLPRAFRAVGIRTALFDATDLATCRMYVGLAQAWNGFAKNATEGMATPTALPIWTVLLAGGHVLPFAMLLAAAVVPIPEAAVRLFAIAAALSLATRFVLAMRFRQSRLGAVLHPLGIAMTLAIQAYALVQSWRGRRAVWRGRSYQAP